MARTIAERMGRMGRGGDSMLAHVTPGETVMPRSMSPIMRAMLQQRGIDPERYTVGGKGDSRNPRTGLREYFHGGDGPGGEASASDSGPPGGNDGSGQGDQRGEGARSGERGDEAYGGRSESESDAAAEADRVAEFDRAFNEMLSGLPAPRAGYGPDDTGQAEESVVDRVLNRLFAGIPEDVKNLFSEEGRQQLAGQRYGNLSQDQLAAALTGLAPFGATPVLAGSYAADTARQAGLPMGDAPNVMSSFEPEAPTGTDAPGGRQANDANFTLALRSIMQARIASGDASSPIGLAEQIALSKAAALDRAYATRTLRGLSPEEFDPIIQSDIDARTALIGSQNDISGQLPINIGDLVFDTEQGKRRTGFLNTINEFAPPSFENVRLPDTFDDSAIGRVLASRRLAAEQPINISKARGNILDVGYNTGLSEIAQQVPEVERRLQDVGRSFLEGYRGEVRDIAGEARRGASEYQLGTTFDPSSYKQRIESRFSEFPSRAERDIGGAVEGTELFDPQFALQQAGLAQGPVAGGALYDTISRRRTGQLTRRGLGTQGAF